VETKKIAIACFVGGVLFCVAALLFSPTYWWLGLIAGFAGGYISYEFRDVLKAIPVALQAAKKEGVQTLSNITTMMKHPFVLFGLAISFCYFPCHFS